MRKNNSLRESKTPRDIWLDRHEAIGRAQSRYLYLLTVIALICLILEVRFIQHQLSEANLIVLPFLKIKIDPIYIWAVAPILIGLFELALLGTMSALRIAIENIEQIDKKKIPREAYDRIPNFFDFIIHNRENPPKLLRLILPFLYPFYLTIVGLLGLLIGVHLIFLDHIRVLRIVVILGSAVLWPFVVARLVHFWRRRMEKVKDGKK